MNQMIQTSDLSDLEKFIQAQSSKKATSLKVRVFTLKYRLWLLLLREVSLLLLLMNNFEKVPKGTPSYRLTKLFVERPKMKSYLLKLERKLRNNIY